MITAVFFDLDGTLADTAPDLAAALNQLLVEHHQPALPFEKIRPVVSRGGNALIELAFGIKPNDSCFPPLRERFLEIYQTRLHNSTYLFEGMEAVLDTLEVKQITWGVITNKPAWLTHPLMEKLQLTVRAGCIVCGDSTANPKPHPAPMLLACELTHSKPASSLYVGDAERDVAAGRAAGMHTLVALYGYIDQYENPGKWQADGMINLPDEIVNWIDKFNSQS
jgi:phosphoglycolate phosphatase